MTNNNNDLNILFIDPEDNVYCDFCNEDFTNSNESGGFLFQSKTVCPYCSERIMISIKKYSEEKFIKGYCPKDKSFADWIRSIR